MFLKMNLRKVCSSFVLIFVFVSANETNNEALSFLTNKSNASGKLTARSSSPRVEISIPNQSWDRPRRQPERTIRDDLLIKEDPSEVEEFPVKQVAIDTNDGRNGVFDYDPGFGANPNAGLNPLFPGSSLDAFTVRRAIDREIVPGKKVKFLDTVTQIGRGWNNFTNEFVCDSPGIFFFTFTACGERYRHFRITLKHNNIGVVSAYGDVSGYQMATNSAVLRLFGGDRVYLELNEGGIYEVTTFTGRAYNTFSGFRIL